jgi:galactokinase
VHDWSAALARVYGDDAALLAEQERRIAHLLPAFRERWGAGPVLIIRAPGRVNLIGEHTDYNHGYVLPMALDKDIVMALRPRPDALVRLANAEPQFGERSFEIAPAISRLALGDWANYAQGPAQLLAQRFGPLSGFDALVDGSPGLGVPRGAGLSSSSALTVAAAVALVTVNDLPLSGAALAEACGQAEWYVGTRGGVMDQFASLLSRQGHALFLDCRPDAAQSAFAYAHVPLPDGYQVVVIDSQVHHANTGPHFNRRVAEGRIGVALLRQRYPAITHLRDVQAVPWDELEPLLPAEITSDELQAQGIDPQRILDEGRSADTDVYNVRARCRHVYSENQRVLATIAALEAGDIAGVGQLMVAAHRSAAADYDISTPELDLLVDEALRAGAVGARLTGAGWGGCVVALAPAALVAGLIAQVTSAYAAQTGLRAESFVCRSAQGAGLMLSTNV